LINSIYVNTLGDALLAHEVMEEFYGDCDIRVDGLGECHLTAPSSVLAILVGGIENE
jgi:hypothetical protein